MNCTQALAQLLEVDLEHGAMQDPALAAHVAGCARCARAAAVLQGDTAAMATAVRAGRAERASAARARRRAPFWVPGLALAATAAFVVLLTREETIELAAPVVAAPAVAAPIAAIAPPAPRRVVRRAPRPDPRLVPIALAVHDLRTDAVAFTAEPMQVARFEATPVVDVNVANGIPSMPVNHADAVRAPEITVTNRLGTRAMVARTADPNIVVVWLGDEPNRRNP